MKQLLVDGCPFCAMFKNPEENIKTELYFPEINEVKESDFIIIHNEEEDKPMIIFKEHVTDITQDNWRTLNYVSKKTFGKMIRYRVNNRYVKDHFHCYILR